MSKRANVVALAIIIVMVTAGTAQSLAGSNSVFTDDIVNGEVTNLDVRVNAISGTRLMDGSVTNLKIKDGTIKRFDLSGDVISEDELDGRWVTSTSDPGNNSVFERIVKCPADYEVLSGGGTIDNSSGAIALDSSGPALPDGTFPADPNVLTPSAWKMVWTVEGGYVNPTSVQVYAYCIHSGS